MKQLKGIRFRAKVKGNGIVNYDGEQQKQLIINCKFDNLFVPKNKKDNTYVDSCSYAKRELFENESGETDYRIKISSDCMRKAIFSEDEHINPSIINSPVLYSTFVLSPVGLLRGYFNADKDSVSYVKASPVTVSAAKQVSDENGNIAKSFIETCNSSGSRTDNSFFNCETIGDIYYEFDGYIDLKRLQFISADPVFDRMAIKDDWIISGVAQDRIKVFYGNDADFKTGVFSSSAKNIGRAYCEYGILLGHNVQEYLVRYFFERLLRARIDRARAYAKVTEVEVAPVYDVLEDNQDKLEWTKLDENCMPDFLKDEYCTFYEECTDEELRERDKMIEKRKVQESARRDEKQAIREEKKKKRAAKINEEVNQ